MLLMTINRSRVGKASSVTSPVVYLHEYMGQVKWWRWYLSTSNSFAESVMVACVVMNHIEPGW